MSMTSQAVLDALTAHYHKPGETRDGEILITEVEAPGSQRRADLVRVGMWQSRGTGIDVHEIKVSRADWLRELDNPAKAEAWWPYCNRFWITAPPSVVQMPELPAGWGLLELPPEGRRRFKVRVQAATREDVHLTVPLMIELLRRSDNQRLAQITQLQQEHQNEMYRRQQEWRRRQAAGELPPDMRHRLNLLKRVEEAIGMQLDDFGGWPKYPPSKITPEELAAFLRDARDHVTAQRRAAETEVLADQIRKTANHVLKALARSEAKAA
jgi:hypothetical protein